jgi:metal-dependent hydrolase (beta-lactamase superfamily II)
MRSKDDLVVRFWGVRGSHPVGGEQFSRFGGNTPCVEIQAGGHTLIFDAGTDIINLGRTLMQSDRNRRDSPHASIFLSHLHHDHTQGLPFFAPLYQASTNLNLFLAFAEKYGQSSRNGEILIPIRLTQSDLADLVGASRRRVNQVIVNYKRHDYISVDGDGYISVRDREALARLCR